MGNNKKNSISDVVAYDKNIGNHSITIITKEKWYKRIWNYFSNPFTYIFSGKIRY